MLLEQFCGVFVSYQAFLNEEIDLWCRKSTCVHCRTGASESAQNCLTTMPKRKQGWRITNLGVYGVKRVKLNSDNENVQQPLLIYFLSDIIVFRF